MPENGLTFSVMCGLYGRITGARIVGTEIVSAMNPVGRSSWDGMCVTLGWRV